MAPPKFLSPSRRHTGSVSWSRCRRPSSQMGARPDVRLRYRPNHRLGEPAGALGLLVGSFLNVVVYRVPNGLSVGPPSACPGCGSASEHTTMFPLSLPALRGRCRSCRESISVRYPLVEAGVAVFFAAVAIWWWMASTSSANPNATGGTGSVADLIALIAFLWLAGLAFPLRSSTSTRTGFRTPSSFPAIWSAGLRGNGRYPQRRHRRLFRSAAGMGASGAPTSLWRCSTREAWVSATSSLPASSASTSDSSAGAPLLVGAFAAFFFGGIYAIALMLLKKAGRKSGIPFGPWMLAGAWTGIFAGNTLWTSYLSLLGVA